jgi:tubulin-specific chaperone A
MPGSAIGEAGPVRDLRIKTGVLRRALKELDMYTKEVARQNAELEAMGPQHDRFRQISQALDESRAMLLDATTRCSDAKDELDAFLEGDEVDAELELVKQARELLVLADGVA